MSNWVNIITSTRFAEAGEQSALLKCLLWPTADAELFERLLAQGMSAALSSDEKNNLVAAKLNKVMEWRALLDNKFAGRAEERKFCLLCLGQLIAARYSGKAQSLGAIEWTLIRLSNAIADQKPIVFTFCFGGYKSHTSSSHPEVDWAELFNLNYLVSYLYPIIKGYPYGVEVEYESEEVSIQFNNVPQEKTDQYTAAFKNLLAYYTRQALLKYNLPLVLKLVIARELYGEGVSKLYELMEQKKPAYRKIFEGLPVAEKEKWLQRAASNYRWEDGIVGHGNLSEAQRYEIIKAARIDNEAFLEADYDLRKNWFEDKYRIPLTGTWGRMPSAQPIDGWLHIKSTAASVVDCWIGTGFLEAQGNNAATEYRETILSKSQVEMIKGNITYLDNPDEELKQVSKNFNKIPVFGRKG